MKKPVRSLSGKTVVVTGASSGVGRATALAFAKKGANLILAARGKEALQSAAEACEALGVKAIAVPTDMAIAEEVKRLAEQALQFNGRIDVWVNNAGVLALGAFENMPTDVIDGIIKTNLLGYMHGAHEVLPIFKKQRQGTLINNISIGGWVAAPYGTAYSAAKYGLRGMVESLQGEVNDFPNIHICALYPGFQDTPGILHAANYFGVKLSNPPLNFNPTKLANSIVQVALYPTNSTYPDWSAVLARGAYALFPGLTRTIMTGLLRLVHRKGTPAPADSGNVLHPVSHDMRVQAKTPAQRTLRKAKLITATAIGAMALWMIVKPKHHSSNA